VPAGKLALLADRPAWVSLKNARARDEYLKNRAEPAVPLVVEIAGQRVTGDSFRWTPTSATKPARAWTGLSPDQSVSLLVKVRPDGRVRDALLWQVEVRNAGAREVEVLLWPLALDGILQLGSSPAGQRVVMPTWIGFDGPIATYAAGCSGTRSYPQNLSMQYMALYNPTSDTGLAVWMRDPTASFKYMDIVTNDTLEAAMTVRCAPVRLPPGGKFAAPPVVLELSDANWYDSARHYADWWRSNLAARRSPAWVARAGQVFHQCTGYSEQGPSLAALLPATYQRFQQPTRKYPTPMTFDLGETPEARGGGAAGEAAGLAAMRDRFGAPSFIYMPAITEYADLPVSKQKTDWYVLRPDGTMLPAWEKNATFCPGYQPVVDYRVRQAITRITDRGADGLYVDESLAQSYHPCYNPLHAHPTPYDWGQSQRRLWQALRESVDATRSDVGLITEGCCDVVVDYADGFMAWVSGPSDGVPPMRVAFPERAYFSNGPAAPAWASAKAAYGLQFVNGVAPWFVNQPPPPDLAEWTGFLADWRERLADFIVAGKVLRNPSVAPGTSVMARAYAARGQVLLAAVNMGSKPWTGRLGAPPRSDWPIRPSTAKELVAGQSLPTTSGTVRLTIQPSSVALVLFR
jgi:hypothetical protein